MGRRTWRLLGREAALRTGRSVAIIIISFPTTCAAYRKRGRAGAVIHAYDVDGRGENRPPDLWFAQPSPWVSPGVPARGLLGL